MLIKAALVAIVALVGLGLAGLGVAMGVMALRTLWEHLRTAFLAWRSRSWTETTGTITRSVVVQTSGGRHRSFAPGLAYAYEVAGQAFTGTRVAFHPAARLGASGPLELVQGLVKEHPKGSRVPVFFDPDQPGSSTLDRSGPGLGGTVFFFVLLLVGAAALIPLGIHVLRGAAEPPQFAAGELPSLAQQVGGLLAAVGGILLPVAGLRLLRARRERPLLVRLGGAVPTRARDVRDGQDVAVFGRAEATDAGTAMSPITGESVLYCRAVVHAGGTRLLSDASHCDFHVRDESGRILVVTGNSNDQVRTTVLPDDAAVRTWLDHTFSEHGFPVPQDFKVEWGQIVPGGRLLAVGRAEWDRELGAMVLEADPDDPTSLVLSDVPLPELIERVGQGARRARRRAAAAGALVLVGALLMALC